MLGLDSVVTVMKVFVNLKDIQYKSCAPFFFFHQLVGIDFFILFFYFLYLIALDNGLGISGSTAEGSRAIHF